MKYEEMLKLIDEIIGNFKIEYRPNWYCFEKVKNSTDVKYILHVKYGELDFYLKFYGNEDKELEIIVLKFIDQCFYRFNQLERENKTRNYEEYQEYLKIKNKIYKKESKFKRILNKLLGGFSE